MTQNVPTVTVLIPTYNRKHFLSTALRSILEQIYQNISVIIYDDGSTDNTDQMIKEMNNGRVRLFREEVNHGVSYARNRLLDLCPTEIAAWMDSDDVSNVHRLQKQYEVFCLGYDLVYSAFDRWTEKTEKVFRQPPYRRNGCFANASGFFRVDREIRFDEKLLIGEDNDWQGRMEQKYKKYMMPEALYYIRFHQDRLGVNKGIRHE